MRKPTLKCSVCEGPMWQGKGAKEDGTQTCRPCRKVRSEAITGPFKTTCNECGKDFESKRAKDKACSTCRHEATKARAALKGPCTISGCDDPQFCKSLCNRHYWADRQAKSPRPPQYYEGVCAWCEKPFRSQAKLSRHCSLECGIKTRSGYSNSMDIVLHKSPERILRMWVGHALPSRKGRALSAGPCIWCGDSFVGQYGATYCSKRCALNASWKRRYDTRGGVLHQRPGAQGDL